MENATYKKLLKLVQFYIFSTLLLFLCGPISWQNDNNEWIISLVIVYTLALSIGYRLGMSRPIKKAGSYFFQENNVVKMIKKIIWCSIFYSLLFIVRYGKTFSISEIINNMVFNIINPALKYAETHEGAMSGGGLLGGSILSAVVTFSGLITIPAIILPIIYYEEIPHKYKILGILGIMLQVISKTIIGTNEGIFDIGILIITAVLISNTRNKNIANLEKIKKKGNIITFFFIGIIVILLLTFFTNNINQRTGATYLFPTIGINWYDYNAPILQFVPEFFESTLAYLTVYLCEGYYGMALALKLDWVPTWGTGFSSFIRNNLQELFDINLIQYSYQGRAEIFGWGANRNWHTAYTWFANDVSFFGVVVIMFLIGWLLIQTYKDSVENRNPFSAVVFGIILIQILFLSANNKIFASSTTFIPFWIYLFLWKATKHIK